MLEQQQLQYMIYNIIIVSITLCLTVITLSRFIYIPYIRILYNRIYRILFILFIVKIILKIIYFNNSNTESLS